MSGRSPSRTRSHTPSCPDDVEEDGRRRAISQLQQDVERELDNADRVLSTIDTFTGSRGQSRTGSQRSRGENVRRDVNADAGAAEGARAYGQRGRPNSGANDPGSRRISAEECPRSGGRSIVSTGGMGGIQDPYGKGEERGGYDQAYGGPGGPGGGYGGPGGPYGATGGVGGGYGGPVGPYDSTGGAGGGYGGPGGPGAPYGSTGMSGAALGSTRAFQEESDAYAVGKGSGPGSGARSRDPSRMGFAQGGTASGTSRDGAGAAAFDSGSRGRSPPSVHYSPSTAMSARGGSPTTGPTSETRSGVAGGVSPTGTHSTSRAASRTNYDPSRDSSGYERGGSPTGNEYSGSNGQGSMVGAGSGYEQGMGSMEQEEGGSRTSPAGGSRGTPSASGGGASPFDASQTDQSLAGKICPAALHGKCPAFARDSSAIDQMRGSGGSKTQRPLSRIDEGPSREEMTDSEVVYGRTSCYPKADFNPPAGTCCQPQPSRMPYAPCPSPMSARPRRAMFEQSGFNSMEGDNFTGMSFRPQAITFEDSSIPKTPYARPGTTSCTGSSRLGATSYASSPMPQTNGYAGFLRPGATTYGSTSTFQSSTPSMPQPSSYAIPSVTQSTGYTSSSMGVGVPASQHEHHFHHDHHDHADHAMTGFDRRPLHDMDEKATSALNRLSQLQKTPSYLKCKPDRGLDLSSCDKSTKAPRMVKFPEKPPKELDELQDLIDCETTDVHSAYYLTSDEKKTYKKPCPKQQRAQENVKSIVKAQPSQSCAKDYTPLEHPDPDDITPELAASMMFSQEQGVKMNECPDDTIKRLFPDMPRPFFPMKLSAVHIVDSNQEDQEEMIEKSATVPSEGVSDSAYTRTMQSKGEEMGAQKSYDLDFAVGAEKREYVLVAEKPQRYNKVQFRGNLPTWFPGYLQAFPEDGTGIRLAESPSGLLQRAWATTNPGSLPSGDVVVLD